MECQIMRLLYNPLFLLLKLSQIQKNRIGLALPFFFGWAQLNYWIVNCGNRESIGEPDAETMGSTPLVTK